MADYVISRKRSRPSGYYAVDPCLGYYVVQSSVPQQNITRPHAKDTRKSSTGDEDPNADYARGTYDDWDEYGIPSSLPEENDVGDASAKGSSGNEQEDEDMLPTSDWIELCPSRAKHAPCPTIPKNSPSAVPPPVPYLDQNSNITATDTIHQALTVEGFLKRSNQARSSKARKTYHTKTYSKKKRFKSKATDSDSPGSTKIRDSHEHEHGHEADNILKLRSRVIPRVLPSEDDMTSDIGSSSPIRKSASTSDIAELPISTKRKRRHYEKPLKQRIYEAAISTRGHPEDEYAQDETDPSRPPLHFVPGPPDLPNDESPPRKKKRWNLIDPRKSKAIRTATFASKLQRASRVASNEDASAALSRSLDRLPIERWKWDKDVEILSSSAVKSEARKITNAKNSQLGATGLVISDCPPLAFLPVDRENTRYTALFRKKRDTRLAGAEMKIKKKEKSAKSDDPYLPEALVNYDRANDPTLLSQLNMVPLAANAAHNECQDDSDSQRKETQVPITALGDDVLGEALQSPYSPIHFSSPTETVPFINAQRIHPVPPIAKKVVTSPIIQYESSLERQNSLTASPLFTFSPPNHLHQPEDDVLYDPE